jgi:hypothetical protein
MGSTQESHRPLASTPRHHLVKYALELRSENARLRRLWQAAREEKQRLADLLTRGQAQA